MKLRTVLKTALPLVAAACLVGPRAFGARTQGPSERRILDLNAGETRVIDHIKSDSTPLVRVVKNPHAMLIHRESPDNLVIVGAERGQWEITVELDNGRTVTYQVNVSAVADRERPLEPGVSPPAGAVSASSTVVGEPGKPVALGKGASAAPSSATTVLAPAPAGHVVSAAPSAAEQEARANRLSAPVFRNQMAQGPSHASAPWRANPSVAANGGSFASPSVSGGPNYLPANGFSMMAGSSQIVDFRHRLKRISVADTSIADVQVVSPYQLNLVAHKPGFTTLAIWDDRGHYEERQVRVDASGKQQVMLSCIVAELNRTNLENQGINYSVALSHYGVSLVGLPGAVGTPYSQQTSGGSQQSTVLPPGGAIMPLLLSQNLTYGLSAQNSNVLTQTLFQYLESHNLGKILAEPHLLANSGAKAKFLSGGEIPIVIAQALNTSIVFKDFGTSVVFLPTVVGVRDIELLVKTEVSQPDYAHGVELMGFQVPAFVTRRADTMVRLRDGQTLIIAGLILHQKESVVQKVPYLGDIPYLGGLFRNTSWQNMETDLVMSVTPRIVNPIPPSGQVFLPTKRGPLTAREIRTTRLAVPNAARPRF